uniref:Endonuclease/exonuclease/phosphatase domain-containing protein n=1 Tax=Sander lucioperca TaxID=283035 RepID=A0A8C9ZPQ5_SANLU
MWPGTNIADDKCGRLLVIECVYEETLIRLINIYASNIDTERKIFFKDLKKWCTDNTIILGDFNVIQTEFDISENNVFKGDVSRRELNLLLNEMNMCDVWRTANPKVRTYSRRQLVKQILKQSRIDLFKFD